MSRPNSGARLRPNRLGIYYIHWTEDGRSRRLSTGTGNLPQAQQIFGGFLLEKQKFAAQDKRWTVRVMFDYYETNHAKVAIEGKKALKWTQRVLRQMARILGEHRFVDELAADDFVKFCETRRRESAAKGNTLNDSTLRRELTIFVAAANFAVRNRKIDNRHVPVVNLPEGNEGRDRWLTKEEAQHLLTTALGTAKRLPRVYRLIAIALGTAKRRGAIEALKWFQVDLKNRLIDFRRPGEPETSKRRGRAPISNWLLPILQRAYDEKTSEYVLGVPGDLWEEVNTVTRAAGLHDVTCHTLRHTWGTWAAQGGMSMWAIAGIMGCSVDTATKNYLHHCPEHLRNVADQVTAGMAEFGGATEIKAQP